MLLLCARALEARGRGPRPLLLRLLGRACEGPATVAAARSSKDAARDGASSERGPGAPAAASPSFSGGEPGADADREQALSRHGQERRLDCRLRLGVLASPEL